MKQYDRIIIGAGFYGLYAALECAKRKEKVLILEWDTEAFQRATYVNQARVHMGYHYPRSLATATKSAGYFRRFCEDYSFCIHKDFQKIYATSEKFSWSNAKQFAQFCKAANISCEEVPVSKYFKDRMCDGAFLTEEYTYDAGALREYYIKELQGFPSVEWEFGARIQSIVSSSLKNTKAGEEKTEAVTPGAYYEITTLRDTYQSAFVLNATYASANQILEKVQGESFPIKYELCEIILCKADEHLNNLGITVMDGPFFSIMPFGQTGYHSLTAVTFTPHSTCMESLPRFDCQKGREEFCNSHALGNCNECPGKPETAYPYMSKLARKYLKEEYDFAYEKSLFSMKPILKTSEVDDSRPTVIRYHGVNPTFVSVLSGKINTVYDLDEVLFHE